MARKTYNPFKMSGPWIGAVMGLGYSLVEAFLESQYGNMILANINIFGYLFGWFTKLLPMPLAVVVVTSLNVMCGFLVGWGIHSFFRALRGERR